MLELHSHVSILLCVDSFKYKKRNPKNPQETVLARWQLGDPCFVS